MVVDLSRQSGSDYLLQRFLGPESVQAMRKALGRFGTDKQGDQNQQDQSASMAEISDVDHQLVSNAAQASLTALFRASQVGKQSGVGRSSLLAASTSTAHGFELITCSDCCKAHYNVECDVLIYQYTKITLPELFRVKSHHKQ